MRATERVGPRQRTAAVDDRLGPSRRVAAFLALTLPLLAIAVAMWSMVTDLFHVVVVPPLLVVAAVAGWTAVTRTRALRRVAAAVAVLAMVLAALAVVTSEYRGLGLAAVVVLLVGSATASRYALVRDHRSLRELEVPGRPVPAARRGVLLWNPGSGAGAVAGLDLAGTARARGIEVVMLRDGDDLATLARAAVARGADVLGIAGGDGSLGAVAEVAAEADVAFVCVPTGTRNHFALDLGLVRDAPLDALDAFGPAVERRIDLGSVNGRPFVNNVSLGVYAQIVHDPEYREAKRQTVTSLLPQLLAPEAEPFDLRLIGPDGTRHDGPQIVQVSNNPYALASLGTFGSRPALDTGLLGIALARISGATAVAAFVAAQAADSVAVVEGVEQWDAPELVVEAASPVEAAIDGEPVLLDPPLRFTSRPRALRVRLPATAIGYSPAALRPPSLWWSVRALLRALAGRATPVEAGTR